MKNYDFSLDMTTDNSNSVILKNINPKSKVLEIGCAHGRMTKYLKEILECYVCIAEINELGGEIAKNWADIGFVGDLGNVENNNYMFFDILIDKFGFDNYFDNIIYADVLEHLHYPNYVLRQSKRLLSPNGSIWISIPNVAHNSVIIDLWNNKFEYRETGLLDETHLRFFTEKSLRKMILSEGFSVEKEINLRNVVENTEFKNSYNDVPKEIIEALQQREFADVYQFVWNIKPLNGE